MWSNLGHLEDGEHLMWTEDEESYCGRVRGLSTNGNPTIGRGIIIQPCSGPTEDGYTCRILFEYTLERV